MQKIVSKDNTPGTLIIIKQNFEDRDSESDSLGLWDHEWGPPTGTDSTESQSVISENIKEEVISENNTFCNCDLETTIDPINCESRKEQRRKLPVVRKKPEALLNVLLEEVQQTIAKAMLDGPNTLKELMSKANKMIQQCKCFKRFRPRRHSDSAACRKYANLVLNYKYLNNWKSFFETVQVS